MKTTIHPTYYSNATVVCGCGNTFTVGSTKERISVEICAKCHPLYTGEQRFVDTKGQVEKFATRMKKAQLMPRKVKKERDNKPREQKSLRDLLSEV